MVITDNSGHNNARYLVAWNIDPSNHGNPTIGPTGDPWGPLIYGPDNLGNESQGGGLAIANLDTNGRPELVILDIDNPSGPNGIWYTIAWNLDLNGVPTTGGGCTQSPCWTLVVTDLKAGYATNGGGCAISDLNGDGKPELYHQVLDNPFTYY